MKKPRKYKPVVIEDEPPKIYIDRLGTEDEIFIWLGQSNSYMSAIISGYVTPDKEGYLAVISKVLQNHMLAESVKTFKSEDDAVRWILDTLAELFSGIAKQFSAKKFKIEKSHEKQVL